MTADELQKFLDENAEDIKNTVRTKIIDNLLSQHSWDITVQIRNVVSEFVEKEIIPEIRKELIDQKGVLVETAKKSLVGMSDELSEALMIRAAKNINGTSYDQDKIIKALFGIY